MTVLICEDDNNNPILGAAPKRRSGGLDPHPKRRRVVVATTPRTIKREHCDAKVKGRTRDHAGNLRRHKRGRLSFDSFESVETSLLMSSLPDEVLNNSVFALLSMQQLSRLDRVCRSFRENVRDVTRKHVSDLKLRAREGELLSQLRLPIHISWVANGANAGVADCTVSCMLGQSPASKIYSCGSGTFGQVGHGNTDDSPYPLEMRSLRKTDIVFASGGGRHSCAISRCGDVYSWGKADHGQLGIGIVTPDFSHPRGCALSSLPKRVQGCAPAGQVATESDVFGATKSIPVTMVAGFDHTVVVYRDGSVSTFGRNGSGRLGLGRLDVHTESDSCPTPVQIDFVHDGEEPTCHRERFLSAGAGLVHTALISDMGKLYMFGHHQNGRLGCKMHEPQMFPMQVDGLKDVRVVHAALGSYHTVVLTGDGEVYTFGHGSSGQLGQDSGRDIYTPQKLEPAIFNGEPVVQVAAGYEHTVVLTLSGHVYTFGLGVRGQLGHGSRFNELVPRRIDKLSRMTAPVIQISASGYHTAVRLADGRVLSFGNNDSGQLGHGNKKNCFSPKPMKGMDHLHVNHVCAGAMQTLLLATPLHAT